MPPAAARASGHAELSRCGEGEPRNIECGGAATKARRDELCESPSRERGSSQTGPRGTRPSERGMRFSTALLEARRDVAADFGPLGRPKRRAAAAISASWVEPSNRSSLPGRSSSRLTFAATPCSSRKSLFAASWPGIGLTMRRGRPSASASELVKPPGLVMTKSAAAIHSCMFVTKPSTCVG